MKTPPFYRHYRAEKEACQASLSAFGLWKKPKALYKTTQKQPPDLELSSRS